MCAILFFSINGAEKTRTRLLHVVRVKHLLNTLTNVSN